MVTTAIPTGAKRKSSWFWKLLAALLVCFVAVLAAVVWFRRATREALPQIDGTITLQGLKEPVEVLRDAQGVPHIRAKSLDDLLFAQGYITAQDRLWQMDILRRLAAGELAEIEGKSALRLDERQRVLQIRKASAAILAAFPERDRHYLEAYAAGVNAFINTAPHLPVEFRILRYRPKPWQAIDSLLVTANLHQYLGTKYPVELSREKIKALLTPEQFADLYPERSAHDHPPGQDTLPAATAAPAHTSPDTQVTNMNQSSAPEATGSEAAAHRSFDELTSGSFLAPLTFALWPAQSLSLPERCDECVPGSNNWVVSGKHTASGKPLLSNDMHLEHSIPGIWYEAHLTVDSGDSDPALDVAGVTLPGLPLVIAGHNRRIAWGYTNLGPDVQDVYIEITNAKNQYQAPDGWHDFDYDNEVIHVHGATDVHLRVPLTRHGPVITGIIPGETRTLALKWTLYDSHAVGLPLYALDTAGNWQQFRDALRAFGSPSQNVVYADVDGHIGYQACGAIPIRRNRSNLLPVPGNDDQHEWTGYVPFDQLPSVYDPPSGILATANGRIVPDSYPYHLATEWFAPYRTERIYQLLHSQPTLTQPDMLRIQTDVYSSLDLLVAKQFVEAIDHEKAASSRLKQAAGLLRGWNGKIDADSAAPTLAVIGRENLERMLLQSKLGHHWEDYAWFNSGLALENILTQRPARWLPSRYRSYDDMLVAAMEETIDQWGAPRNLSDWKYGKVFPVEIDHPIYGAIPGLRSRTGTGVQPQSGDTQTVKQVKRHFGPSMRMTADLSNLDNTTLNIVFGQSGNYTSPYYRNQWTAWYGGTTFRLPFSSSSVTAAQEHTLLLTPKS